MNKAKFNYLTSPKLAAIKKVTSDITAYKNELKIVSSASGKANIHKKLMVAQGHLIEL
jgi:hypothetical protein